MLLPEQHQNMARLW